ncbi:MAG: hypothetical protein EXR20_03315 [Bacteroidetes bacterium]|nr:hypothetical protein [Bacteroidota bacterium]
MLTKKLFFSGAAIAVILLLPFACKTRKAPSKPLNQIVTYKNDIEPIIRSNCMPCHNAKSKIIDLTTYQSMSAIAKNGELEFHTLKKMDMPPSIPSENNPGGLPVAEREKIRIWINNGSLNN